MRNRSWVSLAVMLSISTVSATATSNDVKLQRWQGQIVLPDKQELPFALELFDHGSYLTANAQSPAQGVDVLPVSDLQITELDMRFSLPVLGAQVQTEKAENGCLRGTLHQGIDLPLHICPDGAFEPFRLTDGKHGSNELVKFAGQQPGIFLAGTLSKPRNVKKPPVIVIAQGSGPSDRDGQVGPHRPYQALAEQLVEQGFAVLRFDKRGVRQSNGDYASSTAETFANDLSAAFAFLAQRDDINIERIGVAGHSEGSHVAAIAANRSGFDFVISLSGVGLDGIDAIVLQDGTETLAKGASAEQAKRLQQIAERYYRILLDAPDDTARITQLKQYLASLNADDKAIYQQWGEPSYTLNLQNAEADGLYSILASQPAKDWSKVTVPVLLLNGDKDVQVPANENLKALAATLKAAGNSKVHVELMANLNHMFQTTENGSTEEYAQLTESFSPRATKVIVQWYQQQFGNQ